jgi:hypothetical protein
MKGLRHGMPILANESNYHTLRTLWFPLALHDPAAFQVILLFSACHLTDLSPQTTPPNLPNRLILKQKAIAAINDGIRDSSRSSSDALIGAVAKMAFFESVFGDLDAYTVHMQGLKKMVEMRGGLEALRNNVFLASMCVWIDIRSALENGTPRHFVEELGEREFEIEMKEEVKPAPLVR